MRARLFAPAFAFTIGLTATLSAGARAQRTRSNPQPASAPAAASAKAQTPTPTTALPTPSNKKVSIVPLYLDRASVKRAADQRHAAKPKGSILGSLQRTVEGDKNVIAAAKSVLEARAASVDTSGAATVVVVIGGETELTQVVESLSRVERPVVVAYVDRAFEDDNYDNTVLNSGLIGGVKDGADNLWIYMPRARGTPRVKPNQVVSAKVATATFWNGLFASTGDAIDVDQLKSLAPKGNTAPSDTAAGATTTTSGAESFTPAGGAAFATGDVVTPKISNVKVLAEPSASAKVVGTVSKTDELVVSSAPKNGFIMVEGATVKGWVSVNLLTKPAAQK